MFVRECLFVLFGKRSILFFFFVMNIIYWTRNNKCLPKYGMLSYEFSVLLGRSRRHRPLVKRQKLAPLKYFFSLMVNAYRTSDSPLQRPLQPPSANFLKRLESFCIHYRNQSRFIKYTMFLGKSVWNMERSPIYVNQDVFIHKTWQLLIVYKKFAIYSVHIRTSGKYF